MKYLTCKPFRSLGIDGKFSLSKGTEITEIDGFLFHNSKRICAKTSQNAYDHFAPNHDGNARERFGLIQAIKAKIAEYVAAFDPENPETNLAGKAYEAIRNAHPSWLNAMDCFTIEFHSADIAELRAALDTVEAIGADA